MAETELQVQAAVAEILIELGIEPESITDSAALRDLGLDSTDAVEVKLELKRRFDVTVKVQVKGDETVTSLRDQVIAEIQRDLEPAARSAQVPVP
jgi:acyl carrier protein